MTREEAIKNLKGKTERARVLLKTIPESVRSKCELNEDIEAYELAIEALQERPKGRWIEVPDKIWSHEFKCSCCGRSVYTMIGEKGVVNWYPYCHCGADMREEK